MIEQQHKSSVLSTRNKFFILLTSLFTVFFLWMCIAKVDITTQAVGVVVPEKNITQLGTMVTGEIVAVNYKQGDSLSVLVPSNQKLIVQGRLLVKDRGYVSVGQTAKVKLANQDQLIFGTIDAKIISISPDAVRGQTSTWYELELEIDKEYFTSGDITYNLVPGINVSVFILTGERTVLSYITTPFQNGFGQALQER